MLVLIFSSKFRGSFYIFPLLQETSTRQEQHIVRWHKEPLISILIFAQMMYKTSICTKNEGKTEELYLKCDNPTLSFKKITNKTRQNLNNNC